MVGIEISTSTKKGDLEGSVQPLADKLKGIVNSFQRCDWSGTAPSKLPLCPRSKCRLDLAEKQDKPLPLSNFSFPARVRINLSGK
mmetsp:Transcript_4620/g.5219  ORF Transcript_4620/g.5219 Transcript_4620/m.5219 type:complete len:85 (-) Transcript_4620:52-306(-)